MARKQAKRTIGGHRFQVTQLAYKDGRRMLFELTQILGDSLASLAVAAKDKGVLNEDAGKAVGKLVRSLDYDFLERASDLFAAQTLVGVDGSDNMVALSDDIQNAIFAGAYDVWVQWLAFCLELNFAESVKKALAGLPGLQQAQTG